MEDSNGNNWGLHNDCSPLSPLIPTRRRWSRRQRFYSLLTASCAISAGLGAGLAVYLKTGLIVAVPVALVSYVLIWTGIGVRFAVRRYKHSVGR